MIDSLEIECGGENAMEDEEVDDGRS